jgi:hypothetical protein
MDEKKVRAPAEAPSSSSVNRFADVLSGATASLAQLLAQLEKRLNEQLERGEEAHDQRAAHAQAERETTAAERDRLASIVAMLSGDGQAQRDAAVMLSNIVDDSRFVRTTVMDLGCISALVGLLDGGTAEDEVAAFEARVYASRALTGLCLGGFPDRPMAPRDVRRQIIDAGAVLLISTSLISSSEAARSTTLSGEHELCAASADLLAELCTDSPTACAAFASAGAVAPLVAMLSIPAMTFVASAVSLPQHAAHALATLGANHYMQSACAAAIPPLCTQLALGSSSTREACVAAIETLITRNAHNKTSLLAVGGAHALVGLLIDASSSRLTYHGAGRALVQLSQEHSTGGAIVSQLLVGVLAPGSHAVEFAVPGHPAIVRRRLEPCRALSVLGTLCSIPFEPVRLRVVYELSPLPEGEAEAEKDAWKDEEEAEEEQKARWPYYKPDWQVQHDRRRLEVVPLHC